MSIAFVTGATGFVGKHLTSRLIAEGWEVHTLIRPDSKIPKKIRFSNLTKHIYDGSTSRLTNSIKIANPDVVFHLASFSLYEHSSQDVNSLIQSNILLGTQLLEAMHINNSSRLINTGTSWQHFNNNDYDPVCLYAATKQAFEMILQYYTNTNQIKAITLKLFDTYGPDDSRNKLLALLNRYSKSGDYLNMTEGMQMIDIVHIDDVVDAYMIAAQRLISNKVVKDESYAVSSGKPIMLRELVQLYTNITKRNININWGARPYRVKEVMYPWQTGQSLENWAPKVSLNIGLKNLD